MIMYLKLDYILYLIYFKCLALLIVNVVRDKDNVKLRTFQMQKDAESEIPTYHSQLAKDPQEYPTDLY